MVLSDKGSCGGGGCGVFVQDYFYVVTSPQ